MARIKHIALVTDDPAKTAEFYKQHFGLTELYRRPTDTGEKGVWLSDGYIYFAILKYGTEDAPKLGPGQSSELRGIHHIGFQVDDIQETAAALDAAGVQPVPMDRSRPREARPMGPPSEAVNLKYLGPDAVHFDVRQRGWDESIELGMDRYELTPAKQGRRIASAARSPKRAAHRPPAFSPLSRQPQLRARAAIWRARQPARRSSCRRP
jgi:catechol 2,3-dioxygenase-like lactoylglutathione lyase family enzyme